MPKCDIAEEYNNARVLCEQGDHLLPQQVHY